MNRRSLFFDALKCYVVGATMTVPGVSGGSIAMSLGIYDRLIGAVPSLFSKAFVSSFVFLLVCGVSGLLGILSASPLVSYLLENFNTVVMMFFIGLVLGGIPLIIRKSRLDGRSWYCILFSVIGVLSVVLLSFIPPVSGDSVSSVPLSFFYGIIVSVGFVLPGISTTYLLVVLGLYKGILDSLNSFNLIPLIPLILGILVGTLLLTGILKFLMEKLPQFIFPVILGFIVSSVWSVFPVSGSIGEYLIGSILGVLGFVLVCFVLRED